MSPFVGRATWSGATPRATAVSPNVLEEALSIVTPDDTPRRALAE